MKQVNLLFLIFAANLIIGACSSVKKTEKTIDKEPYLRIMFYNVENLFDIYDDSLKRDDEFLPDETKHWNEHKYNDKITKIGKIILGVGQWQPPAIVGVCEIENYKCLADVANNSPIRKFDYDIVHYESPDKRGIDVGMFYRKDLFTVLSSKPIPVIYPQSSRPTRDILYVKGITKKADTLHLFVNHWPSRWGGQLATEHKRMQAASVVRKEVDSLFRYNKEANIIIMGDLNDYPTNKSLVEVLKAKTEYDAPLDGELYNLAYYLQEHKKMGTHKYKSEWGVLDQLIISGNLLQKRSKIHTTIEDAHVYQPDFLLEKDEYNVGVKPNRTYLGMRYHGGYSDHLPIYLDLFRKKF